MRRPSLFTIFTIGIFFSFLFQGNPLFFHCPEIRSRLALLAAEKPVGASEIDDKNWMESVLPNEDEEFEEMPGAKKMPRKTPMKNPAKSPIHYLPRAPEVRKLKLEAMQLAEEFARILAERSALQPRLSQLEAEEARLRYLRLKYQVEYYKIREQVMEKYSGDKKINEMLKRHDAVLAHIDDLIAQEEKIDCYHTILERKHKAMEEYHWNVMDNKHPLIDEYLSDLDWKGHETEFKTLYGEVINDYKRIISENKIILKENMEIIKGKEKREGIMKEIIKELEGIRAEIGKVK